jgi:Fe2+/Zn2+ uptake regulation proteins
LPGLGRDTVFRTLNIFTEYGLASKLTMPGGATHYDGDTEVHHHFLCGRCGVIQDLLWPAFEALPWPEELFLMAKPRGASVLFNGLCRICDPTGWSPGGD